LSYEGDKTTVYPGDRITVQTFRGVKGNIVGKPAYSHSLFEVAVRGVVAKPRSLE